MVTFTEQPPRRETLNIRIPADARTLIDRAAQAGGKTCTDFILEAARRAAEDALLDRALLSVDPAVYAAFVTLLDAPPQSSEKLRRTMQTALPWGEG